MWRCSLCLPATRFVPATIQECAGFFAPVSVAHNLTSQGPSTKASSALPEDAGPAKPFSQGALGALKLAGPESSPDLVQFDEAERQHHPADASKELGVLVRSPRQKEALT